MYCTVAGCNGFPAGPAAASGLSAGSRPGPITLRLSLSQAQPEAQACRLPLPVSTVTVTVTVCLSPLGCLAVPSERRRTRCGSRRRVSAYGPARFKFQVAKLFFLRPGPGSHESASVNPYTHRSDLF
jgi:hypothetical protein